MTFQSLLMSYRRPLFKVLLSMMAANILLLVFPWGVKSIIDEILKGGQADRLGIIIAAMTAAVVVRGLFNVWRTTLSHIIGEQIVCDVRQQLFGHLPRISLQRVQQLGPSQIHSRLTTDVESVRRFLFTDAVECIYACLNVVLISGVLFWMNTSLTAISLFVCPIFILIYVRWLPHSQNSFVRLRELHGQLNARINEVLHGLRTIRSLDAFEQERLLFQSRQREIFNTASQVRRVNAWLYNGLELFSLLTTIGILWIGGQAVINKTMTAGELVAFYTYLGMLFAPMVRMAVIQNSYQEAVAALQRIRELLKIHDEVPVHPAVYKGKAFSGEICLQNVSFGYEPGKFILNDLSFTILPGEKVGIVGASGSGKTTMAGLLQRFFDPQQGMIFIDGIPLTQWDMATYRNRIAVVLQDDMLFSGSIRDNLLMGAAWADDRRIRQVAEMAKAHDFIERLPKQYDTIIGERGYQLSGGQRQRLMIARAVLRDPHVLILDEATSSVDALTENAIQQNLRRHFMKRTIITVAHRFSTIMASDRIIVFDQGRIVESGRHDNLLNKNGFYSNLYQEQFKNNALDPIVDV